MKLALLALVAAPLAAAAVDCESGLAGAKDELAALQDSLHAMEMQVKEKKQEVKRWNKAVKNGELYNADNELVGECEEDVEGETGVDCATVKKEIKKTQKSINTMKKTASKNKYAKACDVPKADRNEKQAKNCAHYNDLVNTWIPDTESYLEFLKEEQASC
eukprot:CAMPEP_0184544902 /NCGR_PEP_ID=MMETSP0199_2-20130426/3938_1 /TAXON_ID=1112570 /ORGANISM="Thraustochytrium sp., Strain LLF1b" /LENGTH=160 /DNA_ID=CAMNT_0026939135 /DNA_START=93 /DNA_END=575 /DNA_ORIENTATION=+